MARCLIQVKDREIVGNDVRLTLFLLFFGADVVTPDSTTVMVTASATDTASTWKTKRNAAIQEEATRLGYSWNGRIISDADLLRDA